MAWEAPDRRLLTPRTLVCAQLLHVASQPWLTLDLLVDSDQTEADGRPGSCVSGRASKLGHPSQLRRYGINSIFFFSMTYAFGGFPGLLGREHIFTEECYKPQK